ncbi:MAG: exodeoxyribonuclease III [Gammaproteobacteria bacterium]|nr:exodeoxyribonuclease III [Gammaproteobacteria bacterium]
MLVVSFNVNSVRLRLHQLEAVIKAHQPDVIALQETKVTDEEFPVDAIRKLGYDVEFHGQKTHYGVATMFRLECTGVSKGFSTDTEDAQRRLITTEVTSEKGNAVTIINGYFPQGEDRAHETKFPAKEKFYRDLNATLEKNHDPEQPLLVVGDFNIAPLDIDIGIGPDNVKRWLRTGKASFLPEEREWFARTMDWGLVDTYRQKYPDVDDLYSWFDYRSKGFDRDPRRGIRIDHLLATPPLAETLIDSGIDYDVRAMEKPSDHCPVWSSFNF